MIKLVKFLIILFLASCNAHPKIEVKNMLFFDFLDLNLSKLESIIDLSKTINLGIPYDMLYANCYLIIDEKGNYFELLSKDTTTNQTNAILFQRANNSRYIVNQQNNVIIDFTTRNIGLIKSLLNCNLRKHNLINIYKPDSIYLNQLIYNNLIKISGEGNYGQIDARTFIYFSGDSIQKISVKRVVCLEINGMKRPEVKLVDSLEWNN